MKEVTDNVKIEIKVQGKNVLASDAKVFLNEDKSGSFTIKTKLGSKQEQEFEMTISKYTESEDVSERED